MSNLITNDKKQRVLELYFCGNDRRLATISVLVKGSENTVSKIIQDYLDGKLKFERGNFYVYNSKINYEYDDDQCKIRNYK